MSISYKPGPYLCIADWLSHHNDTENKDQELVGMSISIHTFSMAINIPACTLMGDIRNATSIDTELKMLQPYIIKGWLQNKDD